jgi:hypothetical protein
MAFYQVTRIGPSGRQYDRTRWATFAGARRCAIGKVDCPRVKATIRAIPEIAQPGQTVRVALFDGREIEIKRLT